MNIVFSRASIVPRLMSHTVLEFLSTMKTRVRDSRARICSSPSFVNRMFTVVYPVIAIWSALDSLLIVLEETEGSQRYRSEESVLDDGSEVQHFLLYEMT